MISENIVGRPETREVSQQLPTTTTTATLYGKHSRGTRERPERPSCHGLGTSCASTTGDAFEGRTLPGSKEERSPPRVRRRSVVPPKPKPPPVPAGTGVGQAASNTATKTPDSTRRFCVKPYSPSPRMSGKSPPMAARRALHNAHNTPSSPSVTVGGRPSDEPDGKAGPAPVPPPRRRKNTPKNSPVISRTAPVLKPYPPPVVTMGQPTATKEPIRPPVASPRRSITSLRSEGKNDSCNGDSVGTLSVAALQKTDASPSVSGHGSDVPESHDKHEQRKEAAQILHANIPGSTLTCRQDSSVTGDNNPLSTNSGTVVNKLPGAHPPIPPRLRKKARGTSSPSSSPKLSRGRILPQTLPDAAIAVKDAENVQLTKTVSETKATGPETQDNKSGAKPPRGYSNAALTTNTGEGEIARNTQQQQTLPKQPRDYKTSPRSPPTVKQRRNTLGNRPTALPPKPAPPPKSLGLRRQSLQRPLMPRPPVPRPRSFIPSHTLENQVAEMTNGKSSLSPPQKPSPHLSPRRGLVPATRNLAKSSPSLLAAVHEATTPGACHNQEYPVATPPRTRKTGSESPSHMRGRRAGSDSPSHVLAGILNERRATIPRSQGASPTHVTSHVTTSSGHMTNSPKSQVSSSPSHVTSLVSSPSHVTSQVSSSPSHVTSRVRSPTSHVSSSPSHMTSQVSSSPNHVTNQVSTPSHVTSHVSSSPSHVTSPTTERRGSSSSTSSRIRVLPTPPAQHQLSSGSLGEGDRAKSLSDILSTPVSPASDLPGIVPPKPPTKRRFSKSSSVADMLDIMEDHTPGDTDAVKTSNLAREVVKELKRVTGDGVAGESGEGERGGKEGGVRGEPEGAETKTVAESRRNLPEKRGEVGRRGKKTRLSFAKQRAMSVGDISLLETGPVQSDSTSYTSSEGRSSVMSSESPLLERARQLSKNRKWCNQPEVGD